MTKEQLKEFNGKDGKPAYIAYKGKVYDISSSDFWTGGSHMGRFNAGEDHTDTISISPHGEANIFRFKEVDVLEDDNSAENNNSDNTSTIIPDAKEMLSDVDKKMADRIKWYKKNHPHPKLIHFPIGMFGYAFFAQLIAVVYYLISGYNSISSFLTATGVVVTAFSIIFTIPAIASGALSFYINYNGFANTILKKKMIGSAVILITAVISVFFGKYELTGGESFWGVFAQIDAFRHYNPLTSIYSLFTLINLAVITFVADNGGKITWPQDKN